MRQVSSIAKGSLNLCRAYWRWVNQVADNHKFSEEDLNVMIQKGYFKNPEDAKRSRKQLIKGTLLALPFVILSILLWLLFPKSETLPVAVQPSETTDSSQPEQSLSSSMPAQLNNSDQSPEIITRDFKTLLPAENEELRNFILSDPWLGGFLQDVWIGYATKADLIGRGFYINTLYKHTGDGEGSAATAKGACSPIGFNGAFICGQGMMAPYQWGIQSDEAIVRLNVLEEEWAKR